MALVNELLAARELCKYQLSSDAFLLEGNVLGGLTFQDSLVNEVGVSNSRNTLVRVQRSVFDGQFDIWEVNHLDAGRLEKVGASPYASSVSGGVDWDEAEQLEAYGVPVPSSFNKLTHSLLSSGTDYETSISSGSLVQLSDDFSITPAGLSTKLIVKVFGYWVIVGTSSTSNRRARLQFQYRDSGGAWNEVGLLSLQGPVGSQASSSTVNAYPSFECVAELSQAQLNLSGDWQFRLAGRCDHANLTLKSFSTFVAADEWLT